VQCFLFFSCISRKRSSQTDFGALKILGIMKKSKFDTLNSELQLEYLARGGFLEPETPIKTLHYRRYKEKSPKKKKSKKTKSQHISKRTLKFVKQKAKELNENLPRSEVWFHELWADFKVHGDEYNAPFHKFIPDVLNRQYRYPISSL